MTIKRKRWTASDDDLLRKFHAEGWIDRDIAYIIGRSAKLVARKRKSLNLSPNGKPGPAKGTKMPKIAGRKISEWQSRRWREDPVYSTTMRAKLRQVNAEYQATRWRMPTDPSDRAAYIKIRRLFGAAYAKRAIEQTRGQ